MYLKEALYTVFTQATLILLMHESSVEIWPLALRKNVLDERCL